MNLLHIQPERRICFLADAAIISYEMTAVFLLEKLSVNVHP